MLGGTRPVPKRWPFGFCDSMGFAKPMARNSQNLSLSTQEQQCRMYCAQNGWEVGRVFIEQGESAKTTNRPEFRNLLIYCRENKKKVDFVVVYSLSRFSRHTTDHHSVKAVLSSFGVRLRSATEPIDDSSSGKFIESMIAAVSQFDNDVRAERTIVGMRAAAEEGRWPFPPSIGYRMVSTNSFSRMEQDPERAPLIRSAFELFATGTYEQDQVLKKVTAKGLRTRKGKKLTLQTFSSMLRKPIYSGRISIPTWGIDTRGDFKAIVTDEIFSRVQAVLSGRRTIAESYTKQHPDFPLRHFVRCGSCDQPLTGSWSSGRSRKYAYYRCKNSNCKAVNTPKSRMEDSFINLLQHLTPKPQYTELFQAVVLDVWKDQQAAASKIRQDLQTRIEKLLERKNRLDDAYIFERTIDQSTYQTQLSRLREDQILAEIELNDAKVEELDIETVLNFALQTVGDPSTFWLDGDLDQKQRFQKVMFPAGLTFDGKEFGTAATCLAFSYLREISSGQSCLASRTGVEPVSPP